MLARYFERMKAIVERHGGVVEKFIGDAHRGHGAGVRLIRAGFAASFPSQHPSSHRPAASRFQPRLT
jgi:class 3 adenylate cyclase